ncbi:ubiquitin-conjugating enzyme E2-17 kDa-like isoform X4 [Drosophila pseudoobscura]|uniref:E2 ubiquitin-conjugating enzyme n=1 Tax=Drosophila pseudoobscura pseudoobscura TaxID=46245 RepID=A0A6I8W6A1_DROPS|nr:ubiquitin-conjugating enzyme E2-17 kDa isoform X4 [Drosophila pseudoobscura]
MAPRRTARVLAVPAATPLIRRAAFRRAVEVIPGRVRITTTASQRRRTTTTASRRRAIQSAANQPPAEDPPVTNRRGINSRGTNRRRTNRLPVQDTAPIVTLLQNPDRQRGTSSQAEFGTKLGLRRLRIELARMTSNPTDGCTVELVDDCIYDWKAVILGPLGTPYEGGHFKLRLHFPQLYPARPPFLMFLTEVYHCNIRNGAICVDILYSAWSPALTVEKILLSIRSLLSDPNPESPMNGAAAELYKTDREEYNYMARQWTRRFAQPE